MITTNDSELIDRCQYLKDHAMDRVRTYYHNEVGFNCRMSNLQAALGCAQLRRVSEFLSDRRHLLAWYQDAFASCDWVTLNPRSQWADPVVWMVSALFLDKPTGWRDRCIQSLRDSGIDSRPFLIPLNELPPYAWYRTFGTKGRTVAESKKLSEQGMNLPTSNCMTRADVQRVASAVISFANRKT